MWFICWPSLMQQKHTMGKVYVYLYEIYTFPKMGFKNFDARSAHFQNKGLQDNFQNACNPLYDGENEWSR